MRKRNIGSSLDSWLREEGTYQEVTATAIQRVLARQGKAAIIEERLAGAEMPREPLLKPGA